MPILDPIGETIVAAYITNGGNQADAWKAGHPNSKAKPDSIYAQASKFFSQDKVRLRIVELQAKVELRAADEGQILLSVEQHMRKLEELRDKAELRGQMSAAIAAEVKRGELRRFYVKQVETGDAGDFARAPDHELDEYIDSTTKELKRLNGNRHVKH